jgi:acetyl-CoA synthetase
MDAVHPLLRSMQRDALADPDAFWLAEARRFPWFRAPERGLEWTPPTFTWFADGETNLAWACLDRWVAEGRAGHAALIFCSERGERQTLTYAHLLGEVERIARALRALGIGRGDRVTLSLPTIPEAIATMLACARIGAIHSVVFAGFGAGALGERIRLSGSRLVVTADVTHRRGKEVALLPIVEEALAAGSHVVERVVVLRRGSSPAADAHLGWDEFLAGGEGGDGSPERMAATDPAFILATSGTTATPKLAVHVHGGYGVGVETLARWTYGLGPDDVWWSTSDIGWIVGHSYIVYGPLLRGATTIAYEGALDHPGPDVFFRMLEEHRVSAVFTAPTAARMLMRHGTDAARRADLSSVTRVFCAGEPLNPPAWEWLQREAFEDRVPVIDHMWQTETGGPMIGNPWGLGILPIKPGSAGVPLPGWDVDVVATDGSPIERGEQGVMVVRRPFPSLTPTIWNDPERYARDYWGRIEGVYSSGDAARLDEDGYLWFGGRADEIINIAAHRIGTVEVESALLRHPAVAEAGVTGRPDEMRGEVIAAFCVLRPGHEPGEALDRELRATVRGELGAHAVIGELMVVASLPKTRSGKIMRRVLRAVVSGRDPGDISTIEDEGSVEDAREAMEALLAQVGRPTEEAGGR